MPLAPDPEKIQLAITTAEQSMTASLDAGNASLSRGGDSGLPLN
jgi:hypothetical protein